MKRILIIFAVALASITGTAHCQDIAGGIPEQAFLVFGWNPGHGAGGGLGNIVPAASQPGVDISKDLQQVVVFLEEGEAGKPEVGVLLKGAFEPAKILDLVANDKRVPPPAVIEEYEGFKGLKSNDSPDSIGIFLDNGLMIAGTRSCVKAMLDVRAKKAKSLLEHPTWTSLLARVEKGMSFWGLGYLPEAIKAEMRTQPIYGPLAPVNTFFVSFKPVETGFQFSGELFADKAENLEGVSGFFRNLIDLVKGTVAGDAEAVKIFNAARIETDSKALMVALYIPFAKDQLDRLEGIWEKTRETLLGNYFPQSSAPASGGN